MSYQITGFIRGAGSANARQGSGSQKAHALAADELGVSKVVFFSMGSAAPLMVLAGVVVTGVAVTGLVGVSLAFVQVGMHFVGLFVRVYGDGREDWFCGGFVWADCAGVVEAGGGGCGVVGDDVVQPVAGGVVRGGRCGG